MDKVKVFKKNSNVPIFATVSWTNALASFKRIRHVTKKENEEKSKKELEEKAEEDKKLLEKKQMFEEKKKEVEHENDQFSLEIIKAIIGAAGNIDLDVLAQITTAVATKFSSNKSK
jgi:hypothetical protein